MNFTLNYYLIARHLTKIDRNGKGNEKFINLNFIDNKHNWISVQLLWDINVQTDFTDILQEKCVECHIFRFKKKLK